nr:immunoglobulin heavy chain junction region [Macaca mulatta]
CAKVAYGRNLYW